MVPILDWGEFLQSPESFAAKLGRTCRDHGFFVIENHPVAAELIAQMFQQADAFFALPDAQKRPLAISNNPHNRGWAAMGTESLDETSGQIDQKQAFNVGFDLAPDDPRVLAGEPFRGVNIWPDLPGFKATALAYFDAVQSMGIALHRAFAADLGLPLDYFDAHFDAPMATLRMLSYPAVPSGEGIGAGAHTDYGSITLLMTDGAPGLQVKPRGQDWMDVPAVDGAFIVNIGDCLMRWSNRNYISTPHRVLAPPRARRSIAFFLDPNPDSVIEALPGTGESRYPAITAADYLRSRLDATYKPLGA
ncbi:2-oxoglutarate and iron-dependent oxygenase domain-containing protein [Phaeobacter sp. PT47_59]|uniref:isopenicillin N synthase family dioxygenase n=1 Tax=Phaeobacter sp. PT47_59 TaxID=3029979 RepID=UPI0023800719|nr:2-oxoglutarate and iron-dependent oxygenase domain-containing protein [Phaeobacter sp. PT47_59]MDE4175345.1 2-oxoglutarate and iron-dependent oxygenase domain-containing protein [Phaeobacter sp. PT47_59]